MVLGSDLDVSTAGSDVPEGLCEYGVVGALSW